MRRVAILVLAIYLVSLTYVPASASNVAVSAGAQQVHLALTLTLVQNVTSIPSTTASVDTGASSNVSKAFVQALKSVNPSASPSNLQITLAYKPGLTLNCGMDVAGVSHLNGDVLAVNMTWLPFSISSDLRAGNLSFNAVGARYFKPVVAYYANVSRFVGRPNATITGVSFIVNGTSIGAPDAENYVGNFTMLNLSPLNANVDQWNRTYTVSNNTTTWRTFPDQLLNFGMQIQRKNVTTNYVAKYGYNATISVPGLARAQGDTVLIDVGSGQMEWFMAAVVVLAIICAVGVQLSFRSQRKRLAKFQRK